MKQLFYHDPLNDTIHHFMTDAEAKTIDIIPEIEWHNVKNVLINLGYTVIEIEVNKN